MDKKVKKQWVAALRGGKYKQTKSTLRDEDGYCCLGVLCQLHSDIVGVAEFVKTGEYTYLDTPAVLPSEVRDWADIKFANGPRVTINGEILSLSHHNDTGRTFDQIADAIEAEL